MIGQILNVGHSTRLLDWTPQKVMLPKKKKKKKAGGTVLDLESKIS